MSISSNLKLFKTVGILYWTLCEIHIFMLLINMVKQNGDKGRTVHIKLSPRQRSTIEYSLNNNNPKIITY